MTTKPGQPWKLSAATWLMLSLVWAESTDAASAKKMAAPAKPSLVRADPRGVQRGVPTRIRLIGTNLTEVMDVKLHSPKLAGELVKGTASKSDEAWVTLTPASDTSRGAYEISVTGPHGESNRLKLFVDDIPQEIEGANKGAVSGLSIVKLPAACWGTIEKPGDVDEIGFEARAGQTIVFDLSAKSIGSKAASLALTLFDARGQAIANNSGFGDGGEPLLAYRFHATGHYRIRVSDLMLGGSPDHYYRLSMGAFPFVTGIFPLSVAANASTEIQLEGYNLPRRSKLKVQANEAGELTVPIDTELFRLRRPFKVLVEDIPEFTEHEPNDSPRQANRITVPSTTAGRILATGRLSNSDVDLFQFEAKAGQTFVIETAAARRGSPLDTKIEVLHPDGTPVERLLLQAVRDSQINFRGIDSITPDVRVENWREMELNQFLYMQGEVCKIYRMPQGPDSGFQFYRSNGKRRAYFDTTPTAHALDEPCYIVEPHPPGTKLVSSGLPTFPLYYGNDDDGEQTLGTDSRVHFTAPADGAYLIRVSDTRGFQGELYAYQLRIHEAQPDFKVTLEGTKPTIGRGSGQGFTVRAERIDGFDGEIRVDITGMPSGFTASTPLVIQAGHLHADGSLFAAGDATVPGAEAAGKIQVSATAIVDGKKVVKAVNHFGEIKLGPKPKLLIALEPGSKSSTKMATARSSNPPWEFTIAPGQTVPVWLRVVRNGQTNLVNLDVDNLPHGVIVDNIGLNGVQIRAGENEREIFLNAAKWVPGTDRLCHAVLNSARTGNGSAGAQTSLPILLKVRKAPPDVTASTR